MQNTIIWPNTIKRALYCRIRSYLRSFKIEHAEEYAELQKSYDIYAKRDAFYNKLSYIFAALAIVLWIVVLFLDEDVWILWTLAGMGFISVAVMLYCERGRNLDKKYQAAVKKISETYETLAALLSRSFFEPDVLPKTNKEKVDFLNDLNHYFHLAYRSSFEQILELREFVNGGSSINFCNCKIEDGSFFCADVCLNEQIHLTSIKIPCGKNQQLKVFRKNGCIDLSYIDDILDVEERAKPTNIFEVCRESAAFLPKTRCRLSDINGRSPYRRNHSVRINGFWVRDDIEDFWINDNFIADKDDLLSVLYITIKSSHPLEEDIYVKQYCKEFGQ